MHCIWATSFYFIVFQTEHPVSSKFFKLRDSLELKHCTCIYKPKFKITLIYIVSKIIMYFLFRINSMSQEYYDDPRDNFNNESMEKAPEKPEAQLSQKETDGQKILRFLMERIQQLSTQKTNRSRYYSSKNQHRSRNYEVSRFSRG